MKKMMIGMTVAVLVLSTVICVSSLGSDGDGDVTGGSDFLVGETGYSSFQDAIDAAKKSEEKVVKFNAEGITFSEEKKVYNVSGLTIDLNGKTISTGYMSLILMGTDFTFCNGTINTDTSYSIWIGDDSTKEVPTSKNVTVRGITTNAGVNIYNSEDVTLSDLNVNVVQKEKEPYYAVWCDEDAHAKILSGKYASAGGAVLAGSTKKIGSLSVKGGEFVTRSGQNLVLPGSEEEPRMKPTITGGTFNSFSALAYLAEKADVKIALTEDYTGNVVIPKDATVTIDLAGKKIVNSDAKHTIINYGTLTVNDSAGGGIVDNTSHGKAALYNANGGTVILNGGTFERSAEAGKGPKDNGGNSYYTIQNQGEMTVKDGVTVKNNGKYSSCFTSGWSDGSVALKNKQTATLTIDGGTFDGGINTIKNDDQSTLTVNGGTFRNHVQHAFMNAHIATVNGGEFTVDSGYSVYCWGKYAYADGKLTINGGTFNGGILLQTGATLTVGKEISISDDSVLLVPSGATVTVDPGVPADMGFAASRTSGTDTLYYKSLAAAVSAAAASDKTITILKKIDCVKGIEDLAVTGSELLNHKQISGTAKPATCTEPGHTAGSSCACGTVSTPQEVIPAKGHTPMQVPGKDATCTQDGYSSYTECSVCGTVLTERTVIPATGHSWDGGTVIVQPTHTAEGVMEYKCTKCGETKTETIPKIPCSHTWDAGTVVEEATCSTDGSKLFTCTKCGQTKTEAIPATGDHAWDSGTVIKEPTETESGIIEYKCTKCGQTKIAYIEPKEVEVEEKGDIKITTETEKVVEESEDGAVTETETKTVSKEENGKVTEKTETTKSVTVKDGSETVKETTVVEKEGQATEKTETITSTSQREGSTIVSETKTVEKGQEKTETTVVSVKTEDGSVQTDVSVSDGSTSGIKTVISGDVTDDAVATAVKQVEMASDAVSGKASDVSKNIAVPADNVTLSPTSLNAIALSGASLTITGDVGGIEIDSNVASTMTSHDVDVTISIMEKKDGLTPAQKEKAGESKVIELSARSAVQDFHELGGTAKVRIDMTGMDYKSPEVYWLKDDGTAEKVNAEFGEGYVAIELDHFSLYYIAEGASEPSGNSNVLYIVAAVIVIAILAAAGYVAYKKRAV